MKVKDRAARDGVGWVAPPAGHASDHRGLVGDALIRRRLGHKFIKRGATRRSQICRRLKLIMVPITNIAARSARCSE